MAHTQTYTFAKSEDSEKVRYGGMPLIPALGRQSRWIWELWDNMAYTISSRPARTTK